MAAVECTGLRFGGHAVRRMFERGIDVMDVRTALSNGELIMRYPDLDESTTARILALAEKAVAEHAEVDIVRYAA